MSEDDSRQLPDQQPPARPSPKARLIQWTMAVGVMLVLFGLLFPPLNAAREKAQRAHCLCSTMQIGLSMRLYSGDNRDRFPCDAAWTVLGSYALMTNSYQTSLRVWVCPSDNCGPGGCGLHWGGSIENPFLKTNIGHAYGGFGLTEQTQPDTPMACDRTSGNIRSKTPYVGNTRTHKQDGGNVLFVDGHVAFAKFFPVPMYNGKNP